MGEEYSFNKDTEFYAITYGRKYDRNVKVYESVEFGNVTFEIKNTCNYSNVLTDIREAYSYFPSLFKYKTKVMFLGEETYANIYANLSGREGSIGVTIGFNYSSIDVSRARGFVDIDCKNYSLYPGGAVIIHELAHHYDLYGTYNEKGYKLHDTSILNNLYNKYKNISNRPLRDYSYENTLEFIADMSMYYYTKTYLKTDENIVLTDDMIEYVENYLN